MFIESNIKTTLQTKTILGISLGSSKRDHSAEITTGPYNFKLIRMGTDGSIAKAVSLFREFDGMVDAFGLGGAVNYVSLKNRKYHFKELSKIQMAIQRTKLGDGNEVKGILSDNALKAIESEGIKLRGLKALHMGAIDRYSQAESLVKRGCNVIFGDLMFGTGLPIPVRNLNTLNRIGATILPLITRLPYRWFYPTGRKQDKKPSRKFARYFRECDLIVGDYIWIKVNLPDDLTGKIILTNTTTSEDVEELRKRGLKLLVTTTPRINGRTFGTNIIEAMALSLIDKPKEEITKEDFRRIINDIPIKPNVEKLNK